MTVLPPSVRDGVVRVLAEGRGRVASIAGADRVGGGCINPSARIETDDGEAFFLKWNAETPGLFVPEADGLRALAGALEGAGEAAAGLRVPAVRGVGRGEEGPGWLLLEFVPRGRPADDYAERLGRGLAALHRRRDGGWGWEGDNYIGSLPQSNEPRSSWAEFWAEERLRPQLRRAHDAGFFQESRADWKRLLEGVEERTRPAEAEGPSLLHGDLWSGNVYPGPAGEPVLVDPAVYRGHREVDLAMTELFGGFSPGFYRAYRRARPLPAGYEERRRALYQLYPLLVHVNLFGAGYVGRTLRALRRALDGG